MQNASRKPYNRPKPLFAVANGNKQNDDVMMVDNHGPGRRPLGLSVRVCGVCFGVWGAPPVHHHQGSIPRD